MSMPDKIDYCIFDTGNIRYLTDKSFFERQGTDYHIQFMKMFEDLVYDRPVFAIEDQDVYILDSDQDEIRKILHIIREHDVNISSAICTSGRISWDEEDTTPQMIATSNRLYQIGYQPEMDPEPSCITSIQDVSTGMNILVLTY